MTAFTVTPGDGLGLSDGGTGVGIRTAGTDPLSLTDTPTALSFVDTTRTAADTLGLSDSPAKVFAAGRVVGDALGLSDSGLRTAAVLVGVEALALTDALTAQTVIDRTRADALGLSDTGALVSRAASGVDLLGFVDTTTAQIASGTRTAADLIALSDTADPLTIDVGDALTDLLGWTDTVAVANGTGNALARTPTDLLGLIDTTVLVSAAARSTTDQLTLTDTVILAVAGPGAPVVVDTLNLSDGLGVARTYTTTDGLGMSDTVSRHLSGARRRRPGVLIAGTRRGPVYVGGSV